MAVWALVEPGERVAVFEEDARIDALSAARLKTLYSDLRNESWSAVLLESGQLVNEVSMICSVSRAIAHALTLYANRAQQGLWAGSRPRALRIRFLLLTLKSTKGYLNLFHPRVLGLGA